MLGSIAALALTLAQVPAPTPDCAQPVRVYRDGRPVGDRCPEAARAAGLTVLDLGEDWAPYPFDGAAAAAGVAAPTYRETLVALADQRFGMDTLAAADRHLELYGIPPSPRVVLAAMDDEARHRCHDAVDDAALRAVPVPLRREDPERARLRGKSRARLATVLKRHGAATSAELLALRPAYARMVAEAERDATTTGAIAALQAHLVCEGLQVRASGTLDVATTRALTVYQRRNWIVAGGELDEDTRAAMVAGSRELDLRLALRVLRQRVVDAAGLIADGSARNAWGTVLGRQLDPAAIRYQGGYAPLPEGAADAVAPATEAAARALGWLDFAAARAGLRAIVEADARPIAVALPVPPDRRGAPLALRAVIDRDPAVGRAVLILYAREGDAEVALVRWPTTVGGWKDEQQPWGSVVRKYKPSDVGPRLWRDLVVAPVWYAPRGTPDAELVGLRGGAWTAKEDLIGPGYRSAYGLVMLVHHQPVVGRARTYMLDHAIRTHGSVNYRSIVVGESHGCHRLYNHHALRLATFLLLRRAYVAHGPIAETYARRVRRRGSVWSIYRDDRGFRYELTPPIPIEVLRGVLD